MSTEERIARLERENKVMRTAAVVLAALVGVGVLAGATKPARSPEDHVRASGFVVQDANGNDVASLDEKGLALFAPDGGKVRLLMSAREDATGLSLFDAKADPRLSVRLDNRQAFTPKIAFYDTRGKATFVAAR